MPPILADRRQLLRTAGASLFASFVPGLAFAAATTQKRFVFIIQRGAADGLATLQPTGDPAYAALRGPLAVPGGTALDAQFTLHPALAQTAELYRAGEALFVHAVASSYRERSHFDGQNILETGGISAYRLRDGWLNRLLAQLPAASARAIALSATVPMVLRGPREVASYAPSGLPDPNEDLLARVSSMYAQDAQLHPLWDAAMAARTLAGGESAGKGKGQAGARMGTLAARVLAGDSARIAVIETLGWDTHAGQNGRLAASLRDLDAMLAAMKSGLGPAWSDTLVLVATEFGRTAAANGTGGTDHGTASLAWLAGGAVAGGRVVADWPGLANANLLEGRDLRPTTAMAALVTGALASHFALDPDRLAPALFPQAGTIRPLAGLTRA